MTDPLDAAIADAEDRVIVMWRGEQIGLAHVPERIARIDQRAARELLYGSYVEALETLNPIYAQRLAAWVAAGDPATRVSPDPIAFASGIEPFQRESETPYYAALRRYLALVGIEQGDATEADLWHVLRGVSWSHWFGVREVARAVAATGRGTGGAIDPLDGWRSAERQLRGATVGKAPLVGDAIGHAYATLVGSPEWLAAELHVTRDDIGQFVDYAAFVRLWRLRRGAALLTYEQRLYATDDPALQRAYYAGLVGHLTGVAVAEAGYLANVPSPYASATELQVAVLGAMIVERLERDHGPRWWTDPAAASVMTRLANAPTLADVLAELGYDHLDWAPVLRQIRTRLIGEMSGYGGPNITTRAGSRKV